MASVDDFLTLLPQFGSIEPSTIQAWLDTAARSVDADYGVDQDRAQIYLAAHLMSVSGIGPEKGASALVGLKTLRTASLSMEKDTGTMSDYGLSSFGRMFWPMLQGVRGGVRVTGTGDYPWPYGSQGLDGNDPYAF